jgi:hypothetical protein
MSEDFIWPDISELELSIKKDEDMHHKWPKGFLKNLYLYWGFDKPKCVLCWSQQKVSIHHHFNGNYNDKESWPYRLKEGRIDETKPWWFVLLCQSCHAKIHRAEMESPIYQLVNKIQKDKKESIK